MGRYAQDLIREARENPQALLQNKKFWKIVVFEEFLKEITELLYTDGQQAYAFACLGPAFAELVATATRHDANVLQVRAYGHLGSTHFVLADYPAAADAYDRAQEFTAPPFVHADIDIRRSYLRVYQGNPEDGHGHADNAVTIYRNSDELLVDRHPLGLALAARGYAHYFSGRPGRATIDLTAAVSMINYRTKGRVYYYALHNLSFYMLDVMTPQNLSQTLKNLEACYSRLIGYSQRHIAKYKIRWLQALGQKRFGATRQAERFFKRAFNGFVDMKAPAEVAMVSLDIALLFIEEGRIEETKELARHAYKIASVLGMNADALAALNIWKQATEAELTPEFLSSIRATVTENAQPLGF